MNGTLKRQVLPPGLWVVATPIGNLEDLSPRARQALSEAHAVLCEDTRRTSQLMAALGLSKRLERLDAHAGPDRVEQVARRLEEGESLALVSDAGTPAISDPGARLVARARELGVVITPLPGPSAPVALLSAAGFEQTSFVFRGFFPRKDAERAKELDLALQAARTGFARLAVWFESPERIVSTLELFAERAPDARVVAAKELSKLHERFFAGASAEARDHVNVEITTEGARGEWCFAVLFAESVEASESDDSESSEWVKALQCLVNARVPASEAARQVSQLFGVARNRAYKRALDVVPESEDSRGKNNRKKSE